MSEQQKTLSYVVVAAVMAVAGVLLAPRGPDAVKDDLDSMIGTAFYPEFKNPADATSIEVISYNAATATASPFSIEYKDGLWRIPTHFGYPADAKDRLAKVAASIIGLKREAVVGKTEAEQAEFQVLDPQAEKSEDLKGIGNRLTLRSGDNVLADYIIGKQVPNRQGYYYVRKPTEKQTFIAKLEIDLSTKFTDWIESDVLNLDGNKLSHIDIDKYSLEFVRQGVTLNGVETSHLRRKTSSDPWSLEGLDDAAEEVNQDEVRKLVTALDELKIVGVRPKPESLRKVARTGDIKLPLDDDTQRELFDRGYVFLQSADGINLYCKEGRITAGTDQGVEYRLNFGDVFEGTDKDIETGFLSAPPADDAAKDSEAESDDKSGFKKKSRFMFVTARVNPELLGPEPEEPIKPEPPTEASAEEKTEEAPKSESPGEKTDGEESKDETPGEAKSDETQSEKKSEESKPPSEDSSSEEPKAEDKTTEDTPQEEKPAENPPEPPKVDPQKVYEDALKKYEADKLKYAADVKAREEKVTEAEEKVKLLNARFADWYYVISAESFENMRQGRATLVKEKPAAETKPEGEDSESNAAPENPESQDDASKPKSDEEASEPSQQPE